MSYTKISVVRMYEIIYLKLVGQNLNLLIVIQLVKFNSLKIYLNHDSNYIPQQVVPQKERNSKEKKEVTSCVMIATWLWL